MLGQLHPAGWPRLFSVALIIAMTIAANGNSEEPEIKLWPDGLPESSRPAREPKTDAPKKVDPERIKRVVDPTLTVMKAPADKANGAACVVFPGGGYQLLAWQKEGIELGKWFNEQGVTAIIVKYRVPRRGPKNFHVEPFQDGIRAIRMTRHHSKEWGIDPNRVGVAGFSAGGHLALVTAMHYDKPPYEGLDIIDRQNARPDFCCGIYAAYLGDNYKDNLAELGSLMKVTKDTPPTFLAVTMDDTWRGVQSGQLLKLYKEAGIPVEAHIYSAGGHGYGLRSDKRKPISGWPNRLGDWLEFSGFYKAR